MLLILLGLLLGQWVGHHQVSVCVWKSETCPCVWDVQHDFCLSCWGNWEIFCILFAFSHVLMHLCNSYTMLYCILLYGVDLCLSYVCVCNRHEDSYLAFLLLLHTTYTVYLLYVACCHDSLYLLYLLLLVRDFVMCRNLGHL